MLNPFDVKETELTKDDLVNEAKRITSRIIKQKPENHYETKNFINRT